MAAFKNGTGAKAWMNGIRKLIQDAYPNWANMSREERVAAAKAWRENMSPESRAVLDADYQNYKRIMAAQPQQPQPPTPQPTQPIAPAAPQQQAGIRPAASVMPATTTREEAAAYYGAKGYNGDYAQNKYGQWAPADPEWRHTHNPDGSRRPGIRPGIYGSSPAEIAQGSWKAREAAAENAQKIEDRWQAAENASAARQRTPGQPYVAGGSFSNDGRTNGELYNRWRMRGSTSGIRPTAEARWGHMTGQNL